MKEIFENLEQRLQNLVESSIRFFPWNQSQKKIVIEIINELRLQITRMANEEQLLPNHLIAHVNNSIYPFLISDPAWIHEVKNVILETAQEYDLQFAGPVQFELSPDINLPVNNFKLQFLIDKVDIEQTSVMKTNVASHNITESACKAFLILKNNEIYNIESGLIQIGRKSDNHLSIDSPNVSRTHAQIRRIDGVYMLFDLNSTGGTYLNGNRISQATLRPGDVISLAGYDLVFGEEIQPGSSDKEKTAELPKFVDPS